MAMREPGRPTKLTPDTVEKVCEGIRLRMTHKLAAMRAGICEKTFYIWISEGEQAQQKDLDGQELSQRESATLHFLQAVTRAVADGQAALLAAVHTAARTDWRAAAFILERRHPEDFSRRTYRPKEEVHDEAINVVFHLPEVDPDVKSDELVSFTDAHDAKDKAGGNGSGNGG